MKETPPFFNRLISSSRDLLRDSIKTSYDLFKIIVPISLLVKLLSEFGLIRYLGLGLKPVMEWVGLPGSMGLVWATTMVTNLYGGMVVFASLSAETQLTSAQITVLAAMMLVAHGLPIELRIAQKAGPRLRAMMLLRLGGAFALGWLLYKIYGWTNFLQTPNQAFWNPPPLDPSLFSWAQNEVKNMISIFFIILGLLFLMKLLKYSGIIDLLTFLLKPILSLLGMSREAAPITMIGMLLGLSYGGGLIIQEARSSRIGKYDIFFSLSFMGLCHGIIEDTLVMMILGAHLSGILWFRLFFSLLIIFLLVEAIKKIPERFFDRYLYRNY